MMRVAETEASRMKRRIKPLAVAVGLIALLAVCAAAVTVASS